MIDEILNKIATYQKNVSGRHFKEVLNLEIHTVGCKPMKGSSYIPLSDLIVKKESACKYSKQRPKMFSLVCS